MNGVYITSHEKVLNSCLFPSLSVCFIEFTFNHAAIIRLMIKACLQVKIIHKNQQVKAIQKTEIEEQKVKQSIISNKPDTYYSKTSC